MRLLFTLILFCCLNCLIQAQSYTVSEVPNPKTTADVWVADPDNYLSVEIEQTLNIKIDAIERETKAEVALVVLSDISGGTPHDFGVELFNYWGVGKAGADNGLLILMVMNQRRVEFITGYGMEATLPDLRCYQIQQEYMVPQFKSAQYGQGLIAGVDAVAQEIVGERWHFQPSTVELEYVGEQLAKIEATPDSTKYFWGLDSFLTDSVYQELEIKARRFEDSFELKLFCIALDDIQISPMKVVSAIEKKWDLAEKDQIKNYLIFYYDLERAELAIDYNAPDFVNFLDRETADYLKKQVAENTNGPAAALDYGFDRLLTNLETADLFNQAHAYYEEERKAKREAQQAMMEELKEEKRWAKIRFVLTILSYYLGAMALLILALGLTLIIAEKTVKDPYQKYHLLTFFVFTIWIILFPIPYIWVRAFAVKRREAYRKAPRNSKKNGKPMRMMTEEEEDRYLKSGQITEERINSIHYDVWITKDECDVLVLPYKTIFSKYRNCIKCGWKTYYMVYNRTIRSATTSSSGLGEKKYLCNHCNHVHKYTYVIPQKSESSSSSGGGGSSFGGGSSGGGGAGSSW